MFPLSSGSPHSPPLLLITVPPKIMVPGEWKNAGGGAADWRATGSEKATRIAAGRTGEERDQP
jgi:hypothetical protein